MLVKNLKSRQTFESRERSCIDAFLCIEIEKIFSI